MLIDEFLEQGAQARPDKTALVHSGERFGYGDLDARSNRLAHALIDLGVRRGDRIGVYLENSTESVVSIFAALKAGGVFFIINPKVKPGKLAFILNDCQAGVLVTDQTRLGRVAQVESACPHLRHVICAGSSDEGGDDPFAGGDKMCFFDELLAAFPAKRPRARNINLDLAGLIYTSGSTGIPKAAMMTHLNMVTAADSIISYLENSSEDIIYNVLPLSFDYGLYQVLMTLRFQGTLILDSIFLYPYRIIEQITREKVTGFPLVPTIAAILLKLRDLSRFEFSRLRYITNTAQALPEAHIRRLREIFPTTRIFSMYGLTECKRVSYLPPEELDQRPGSVGKAMPNTEAWIEQGDGTRVTGPGQVGELIVRGAHIMKGYWNRPEETDAVLIPGSFPGEKLLRTGDLFRMDEDGYLYFMGRRDDMLKVAGERISPKEIENALHAIDGISEAAVVGIPDEITGQAIKAFIVKSEESTLTEKDVLRQCAKSIEIFMVPRWVEFIESMPKSEHGKIDKRRLLARHSKSAPAESGNSPASL